jgi:hypothetical protein
LLGAFVRCFHLLYDQQNAQTLIASGDITLVTGQEGFACRCAEPNGKSYRERHQGELARTTLRICALRRGAGLDRLAVHYGWSLVALGRGAHGERRARGRGEADGKALEWYRAGQNGEQLVIA